MKYYKENDYMVGICKSGEKFIFDIDDYDKVSKYSWYETRNQIYGHIDDKSVPLSRYLVGAKKGDSRVNFKNKDQRDFRRNNLFGGNTYVFYDDYVEGTCIDGKTFKISLCDYELVSKHRWHVDSNGYVLAKIDKKSVKQHRLIMGLKNGDTQEIDHINRDCLDNRRENLRFATRSGNNMNRVTNNRKPHNEKGVYMDKNGRWVAQINANGKRKYLGYFKNKEDAIKVRTQAEIEIHGEFRCVG